MKVKQGFILTISDHSDPDLKLWLFWSGKCKNAIKPRGTELRSELLRSEKAGEHPLLRELLTR